MVTRTNSTHYIMEEMFVILQHHCTTKTSTAWTHSAGRSIVDAKPATNYQHSQVSPGYEHILVQGGPIKTAHF